LSKNDRFKDWGKTIRLRKHALEIKPASALRTPNGQVSIIIPTEAPNEPSIEESTGKYLTKKTPSNMIEWRAERGYILQSGESIIAFE
jgi:hypothetical protein